MAKSKNPENEKKFVLPLILGSAAAIIIFHALYWAEFRILTHDKLFIILDIAGLLGYIYFAFMAWKHRQGGKENITRWMTAVLAVAVCVWVGMWCSQYREDSRKGIEYKYEKS